MVYLPILLIGFLFVLALTPITRYFALHQHFLDYPDDRKVHLVPTPLLGGIPVCLALFSAIIAGLFFLDMKLGQTTLAFITGGSVLVGLGLVDDRWGMSPLVKLSGQTLAAGIIVIGGGIYTDLIPFEWLSIALSIFWIVGLSNALNLLDNMDGITGGVSLIAALAFMVNGLIFGQMLSVVIALALAGASLGYLVFNFPPANIFLGDAGSMLIGYTIGVLGIMTSNSHTTALGFVIPIIIATYPIFDTTFVTIIRILEKRPVYLGGKDHTTHRLRILLNSDIKTTLTVYGINIMLAGCAVIMMTGITSVQAGILGGAVIIFLILLGLKLSNISTHNRPPSYEILAAQVQPQDTLVSKSLDAPPSSSKPSMAPVNRS